MMTICIAIIVYIPVRFGTVGYYKDLVACFLYVFVGFIEFFCLFGPKLYIVIWRPDKNQPMKQLFNSPSHSKNMSRHFESDGTYVPTEHELTLMRMNQSRTYQSQKAKKYSFFTTFVPNSVKSPISGSKKQTSRNVPCNVLEDISSVASSDLTQLEQTDISLK